jgi:hypothetical protein
MYNADPRFIMAETYSILHGNAELLAEFDSRINKVNSPEEAIELCLEMQSKAEHCLENCLDATHA